MGLILKLILILLGSVSLSYAAPSISGGSGTIGDGNSYTLTGTSFGTNPLSKPTVFANFNGTSDPNSTLGTASAWDARENMTTSATSPKEGSGSLLSDSGWETTIARVRTDWDMPAGTKIYISWWRKATYTIAADDNWKWIRLWPPFDTDNFPDFYNGQSPGDFNNAFIEDCPVGTHRINTGDYIEPNSTWMLEEHLFLMSTPDTTQNGSWKVYQKGYATVSTTSVAFNCSGQSGTMDEISIQDDPSNFTPTGDVTYDLIYVSSGTWARVYLSSSSTLIAEQRFLQPFSSWSDTSITFTQEHGDLTGTIYAYVCDNDDSCSDAFELGSAGGGGGSTSTTGEIMRGGTRLSGGTRL